MRDDRSHLGRYAEHFERCRAQKKPDFSRWALAMVVTLVGMASGVIFLQWIGVL